MTATGGLVGCQPSPATPPAPLTPAELEADVAGRLKLQGVALADQGGGRFTGTGTNADGQAVEIEVVQEQRRLSWKAKWEGKDTKGWATRGSGAGSVNR